MGNKTYFKPRARLMLELGEQLIKNESVAILEMVKNCYDAFAKNVDVTLENLDDLKNGFIIIQDDGIGMTMDTVVNHWMEPATLNKKNIINGEKKSFEHNGMVRIPLGEKGIGRFGAHKLGNYIKLVSRAENDGEKEVCFEINWGDFDNDKYLSDVGVEVYERKPEIFLGNKSGTRIEIRGLRHVWTAKEYRNVYRNILALNSPFKAADSFSVNIFSNHQQWEKDLISFEELKDKIDLEEVFETKQEHVRETEGKMDSKEENAAKKDAVDALTALGYSSTEALRAVRQTGVTQDMDVETILKLALKNMNL